MAPFLFKLFDYANRNGCTLILPTKGNRKFLKAGVGKTKKGSQVISIEDDEPPPKKTKADSEVQVSADNSEQEKLKPDGVALTDLVSLGFTEKDVEASIKDNWGGMMKDQMFLTPLKDAIPKSTGKLQVQESKGKSIKIMRKKLDLSVGQEGKNGAGSGKNAGSDRVKSDMYDRFPTSMFADSDTVVSSKEAVAEGEIRVARSDAKSSL